MKEPRVKGPTELGERLSKEEYYGLVPEFKAGAHSGEVIAAEIGDLKKGIVFSGDVLNTAARIQGECNRLGRRLLVSRELMEQLPRCRTRCGRTPWGQ